MSLDIYREEIDVNKLTLAGCIDYISYNHSPIMRKIKTTEERKYIAQFYAESGLSYEEVAKKLQCKNWHVLSAVHKYGKRPSVAEMGEKRRIKIDPAIVSEIITLYKEKMTIGKLSIKYGLSTTVIQRVLNDNKVVRHNIGDIRQRKYPIDRSLFDRIDSKEKAYFFGLFCADGHNCVKLGSISIALDDEDSDLLEDLRVAVGINNPLRFYPQHGYGGKGVSNKMQAKLSFSCKEISSKFVQYGAGSHKTSSLIWPNVIPDNLIQYFIRGYLEGDGCISKSIILSSYDTKQGKVFYKRTVFVVSFASTLLFLEGLQSCLSRLNIVKKDRLNIRKREGVSELRIWGKDDVKSILDFIYSDPFIVMKRKYKRYQEFLDFYQKGNFSERIETFVEC